MIFRLFKIYSTGKTIYNRILKPVYLELRKDAYSSDNPQQETIKYTRKKKKKNVVNKKSERSHKRQTNS